MTNIFSFKRTSASGHEEKPATRKLAGRQFEFDFKRERHLVVAVAEQLHGATFLRSLNEARPSEIIDLREAPHFHFTAIAPEIMMRSILGLNIKYRHLGAPNYQPSLAPVDSIDLPTMLVPIIANHAFSNGPLYILVSNVEEYRRVEPGLLTALNRIDDGPWTISVVG